MKYFRKYFRMLAVIGLVFMSAMLGLIPAPGNAHTGVAFASFPSDTWTIVDTPNIANADNYLQEVTVISNNNVWAWAIRCPVGSKVSSSCAMMAPSGLHTQRLSPPAPTAAACTVWLPLQSITCGRWAVIPPAAAPTGHLPCTGTA